MKRVVLHGGYTPACGSELRSIGPASFPGLKPVAPTVPLRFDCLCALW